jgi:transposase-like protein
MANSHDPESKAAVMAALLEGQSLGFVAREYKISKSTASIWRKEAFARSNGIEPKKVDDLDGLLFSYLCASLKSLQVQVEHFGDKAWLGIQNAADLAVLHGVQTDKAVRLLESLAAASIDADAGGRVPVEPGVVLPAQLGGPRTDDTA